MSETPQSGARLRLQGRPLRALLAALLGGSLAAVLLAGLYIVLIAWMLGADFWYLAEQPLPPEPSLATTQPASQPATEPASLPASQPATRPVALGPQPSPVERFFVWLGRAFQEERIRDAAVRTVWTSLTTVALALLVSVPIGYLLSRHKFPGRLLVDMLVDLPIMLPPLVVGVSLLILFRTGPAKWFDEWVLAMVFRPPGIVLAQFVVAAAFSIRTMRATFETIPPRQEQVARVLGAGRLQAFWHVALPPARSGVLAAAIIAWARAIGEFGPIALFASITRGRTEVLSTSIFLEFSTGNIELALAISVWILVISIVTLLGFRVIHRGGSLW